jgi:hypothetical protein
MGDFFEGFIAGEGGAVGGLGQDGDLFGLE